jgi:hypothetical protein
MDTPDGNNVRAWPDQSDQKLERARLNDPVRIAATRIIGLLRETAVKGNVNKPFVV